MASTAVVTGAATVASKRAAGSPSWQELCSADLLLQADDPYCTEEASLSDNGLESRRRSHTEASSSRSTGSYTSKVTNRFTTAGAIGSHPSGADSRHVAVACNGKAGISQDPSASESSRVPGRAIAVDAQLESEAVINGWNGGSMLVDADAVEVALSQQAISALSQSLQADRSITQQQQAVHASNGEATQQQYAAPAPANAPQPNFLSFVSQPNGNSTKRPSHPHANSAPAAATGSQPLQGRAFGDMLNSLMACAHHNTTTHHAKHRKPSLPHIASQLTSRIIAAPDAASLGGLVQRSLAHMNIIHVAAAMKRLATLLHAGSDGAKAQAQAQAASPHPSPRTPSQGQASSPAKPAKHVPGGKVGAARLWGQLCEKALFLSPSVQPRQAADILLSVALIQQHTSQVSAHGQRFNSTSRKDHELGSGSFDVINCSDSVEVVDHPRAAHAVPKAVSSQQQPGNAPRELGSKQQRWQQERQQQQHEQQQWLQQRKRQWEVVRVIIAHCQLHLSAPDVRPVDLARLACNLGRVSYQPPTAWQEAYLAASLPQLHKYSAADLLTTAYGLGRLRCTVPQPWLAELYACLRPFLKELCTRDITNLLFAAVHMSSPPPPTWLNELLFTCVDRFDEFDAPAYSIVLYSLGRLRHRPGDAWLQEFIDSSASLLHDFSAEELSLVVRGAAFLDIFPGDDWLDAFYRHSRDKLRTASGPQLANIGWGIALLRQQPPGPWVAEYLAQLQRVVTGHGMGPFHGQRVVYALQSFGVGGLSYWCKRLNVAPPRLPEQLQEQQQPLLVHAAGHEHGYSAALRQQHARGNGLYAQLTDHSEPVASMDMDYVADDRPLRGFEEDGYERA